MLEIERRQFVLAMGAVSLLAGCSGAPASSNERNAYDPDLSNAFSAEGLSLEASSPDRLSGRFERRGVALHFDLQKTDGKRRLVITSASGAPVLDSALEDGIDTSVVVGGAAKLTGPIDGKPVVEGDAALLTQSAEAQLMPELKEALIRSAVEPGFYRPLAVGVKQSALWFDGTYTH